MVLVCSSRQQYEHGFQDGMWNVLHQLEDQGVLRIQQETVDDSVT